MAANRLPSYLYFIAGVSIGAALGVVLAPAPGAETRRRLADKAHSGREFIDKTREIYEQGRHMAEEAAEMFEEGRKLVKG